MTKVSLAKAALVLTALVSTLQIGLIRRAMPNLMVHPWRSAYDRSYRPDLRYACAV